MLLSLIYSLYNLFNWVQLQYEGIKLNIKLEHTDKSFDCTIFRSYDHDRNIEHQVLYDWKRTRWVMSSTNHADTTPNNSML